MKREEESSSKKFFYIFLASAAVIASISAYSAAISGSGTSNYITKWYNNTTIGNSNIVDDNVTVNVSKPLYENGSRVCTAANGLCQNINNVTYATTTGSGWSNTSTTVYLTTSSNSVGIGKTPSYKLDVAAGTGTTTAAMLQAGSAGYKVQLGGTSQAPYIQGKTSAEGNTNLILNPSGSNVGIATYTPSYKLDVTGTGRFTDVLYVSNPTSSSTGANQAVPRDYIESRGQNLVTNGNGLMADNYNFGTFTFDATETHGGGGSFLVNANTASKFSDELIPVDPDKYYRLVAWGKSGDANGSNYNSSNRQYLGLAAFDADGFAITPYYFYKQPNSADTVLTAPLNPGDTTFSIANSSNWYNLTAYTSRQFAWWPYTNSKGYTYANYTYSRNSTVQYGVYQAAGGSKGVWAAGAITSNGTINLTAPWPGPALPAGTPISNYIGAGTYKYIALVGQQVPNTWTRYEGYIGSYDTTRGLDYNLFSYGTAYVKVLFLVNYHGAADNNVRWSDIWFSELSSRNLESANTTVQGVVNTTAQTFTGTKTFSGNINVTGTVYYGALQANSPILETTHDPFVARCTIASNGDFVVSYIEAKNDRNPKYQYLIEAVDPNNTNWYHQECFAKKAKFDYLRTLQLNGDRKRTTYTFTDENGQTYNQNTYTDYTMDDIEYNPTTKTARKKNQ